MTSNKSNRKINITDSSLSEMNTSAEAENTDKDASKSVDSEEDFSVHFIEGNAFEFVVDISQKSIFEVDRVLSGKKFRSKVKSGWSASLNEIVWEKFKSGCSWAFKRADVVAKEVIVTGACSFKLCNANIQVQTSNNLHNMTIKINNFDGNIVHDGNKRRVTGAQKVEFDKMLKNASASKVHSKLVKKNMTAGDVEPAHIPTKNSLRIRKHRNQMKGLDKDPYYSLSSMAEYEFKGTIHFIGFKPFSVIYSTPLQRKWYKTQATDNRRVLSIDATGLNVIPPKGSRISDKKISKSSG